MQQLNSQAQDLVDAGHFDPNAVEETRIVMEERFVISHETDFLLTVLWKRLRRQHVYSEPWLASRQFRSFCLVLLITRHEIQP